MTEQMRPNDRQLQKELALALDGECTDDADNVEGTYRAALSADRPMLESSLARLRAVGASDIVVGSSMFDDIARLLTVLEVPFTTPSSKRSFSRSSIVFLGCGAADAQADALVSEARAAGTVIVSSDRAAQLNDLEPVLRPRPPSCPRTARVRWNWVGARGSSASGVPASLALQPVALSPGHVPIGDHLDGRGVSRALVLDGMTGDTLVALVRGARCQVLHAVPHWWQSGPIVDTAVERRLLRDVPSYRSLGERYPDVLFGQFSAARVMLSALLLGLGLALSHRSTDEGV